MQALEVGVGLLDTLLRAVSRRQQGALPLVFELGAFEPGVAGPAAGAGAAGVGAAGAGVDGWACASCTSPAFGCIVGAMSSATA